jgi:signal transduction histidine kinase
MSLEELQRQLGRAEARVRTLEEELAETNRGLVALNLELEQRVDARTAELRQLNLDLEARVDERTAQLREANENLQNFAHTAAHDLRSPLRAIKSFSSIVMSEYAGRLDAEGRSLLERVVQSADKMQHLLNDLLEYSKVAASELNLDQLSLRDAVRDALALGEGDISANNAALTIESPLPRIIGHNATVVLLIHNLISNALKFVSPEVRPQIRIWAENRGSHVRLSVQDNGIGIEPKDMGRVFEVFQRLHGKNAYPGTGLGLAIVRKGAERMGGSVGVESQPGKGSRFWIEFQAA